MSRWASSPPLLGTAREWPVIGREHELEQIAGARASGAGAVVLYAPAGVGKSRLAREALAQAAREGARTAWAQATRSAASVPLGACAGFIPAEVRSDDLFELLRRTTDALLDLAGGNRLVLGVDDGQLLDATSAALVLHLATTRAAFVVTTVRSDEPCPDAIVSLWKDLEAPRLDLSRLTQTNTGRLVEALLGGPAEERVRRWIWETSRGNALYARELVLGALGSAALGHTDGLWRLLSQPPISNSLVELISNRLAGLSDGERQTLELLALGEPLYVSEMVELTGVEALTAAESRGLITIDGIGRHGEVRLEHPLYGETIRDRLGKLRGHDVRMRLAATLQARPQLTPDDALGVARWLLDAGEDVPTATLLDAARAANLSGDPELAGQLARQAVEDGAGIEAALVLARSLVIRDDFEQAENVLAAAESSIETQAAAYSYVEQQIAVVHWGLKRTEELRELLDRARRWWPDDRGWQIRLTPLRLRAQLLGSLEDPSAVLAESSELLQDENLDPDLRRRVQLAQLSALHYSGRGSEAYDQARRIRPTVPLRDATDEAAFSLCLGVTVEAGEGLCELEQWATPALQEAVRLGDRGGAGIAALGLGYRCLLEGRFSDASRWLAEAQLHQEAHDPIGLLAVTCALQTWIARSTRDRSAADASLARCRAASRGEEIAAVQAPFVACAEAWAAIANGDASRAERVLLDAATRLSAFPVYVARLLYEALRAGVPAHEVAPTLRTLSERCNNRLLNARAAHATHLAARDGQGLLSAADEFENMGALLYASEAAAQAAQIFVDAGRQDSARRAGARRRELFVEGQGGTLPPVEGLDSDTTELTRREAQVVELVRLGLSNPEIAQRLVLSIRTVESHLYHVMQKLGISDRRDLLS